MLMVLGRGFEQVSGGGDPSPDSHPARPGGAGDCFCHFVALKALAQEPAQPEGGSLFIAVGTPPGISPSQARHHALVVFE